MVQDEGAKLKDSSHKIRFGAKELRGYKRRRRDRKMVGGLACVSFSAKARQRHFGDMKEGCWRV